MMSNELRRNERTALELLPWYVNGTLDSEERELVSRQLLASITCRKELGRLRRLQELIQREDAEATATGRAFERLMARIEASGDSPASRAGPTRAFSWTRLALAASVTAAVAVPLWWRAEAPSTASTTYETLTNSRPADPGATLLRVVFAPGITEPERQELLARHGLTVVGSPTADGLVTLSLADADDQAAIVAALKRDPRISFVNSPPVTERP